MFEKVFVPMLQRKMKKNMILAGAGAAGVCSFLLFGHRRSNVQPVQSFRKPAISLGAVYASEKRIKSFDDPDYKLSQVQIFMRHGARTPLSNPVLEDLELAPAVWDANVLMKTVSHCDINYVVRTSEGGEKPTSYLDMAYQKQKMLNGGSYVGALTTVGQEQAYDLGVKLREAYMQRPGFIGSAYDPSEIYLRSTNVQRTILSLKCCVAGLYGKENLKDGVTIVTCTNEHEILYPNHYFCQNYRHWNSNAENFIMGLPDFQHDLNALKYLLKIEGSEVKLSFIGAWDFLNCRLAHGFVVPEELVNAMSWIMKRAVQVQSYICGGLNSEQVLRWAVGACVDMICTRISDATTAARQPKMFVYSCHDTTLITLLRCLEQNELSWPPFAAHLIFEVYRSKEGKFFVRVVYEHEPITFSSDYRSEKYSELVPLDRFLDMMKKFRAGDWERECGVELDYRHALSRGTV